MADINITKIDEVFIKVDADPGIIQELRDFFTFVVPGAKFSPKFKAKVWDGKIVLMSYTGMLLAGLAQHVQKFAEDREYTCSAPHVAPIKLDKNAVDKFLADAEALLPEHISEIKDYQIAAFMKAIQDLRVLLISPTASGKSLIVYLIATWFDMNSLVIVPTVGLVHQMKGDFIEYGMNPDDIAIIMAGQDKNPTAKIVITTWQSAEPQPKKWFARYGAVFGDEAHGFKAKSLAKIMNNLEDCSVRIGTTGTLDGAKVNKLVIEGHFGPLMQVAKTHELMDRGDIAQLKVRCILLKYPDQERAHIAKLKDYQKEMDFICSHPRRNEFIKRFVLSLKGNTLVLFNYVDKHGIPLHKLIKEAAGANRSVYYVSGKVHADDREAIRQIVEKEEDAIIVASYGTFSTGINIKRLHNIVAVSPTKAIIRILQSIGRSLRLAVGKDSAAWYDIADDFTWKSRVNHTLKHFSERVRIYASEKFDYKVFARDI